MKKTFKSFLPCFPGFYYSAWYDPDYEASETFSAVDSYADTLHFPEEVLERYLADNPYAVTYDYDKYEKDLSEAYADAVSDALDEAGFSNKIHFLKLDRPREYNFRGDYAEAEYEIDAEALVAYCTSEERRHFFADYLVHNCGPRPGFMPFHPATIEYWTDLDNGNEWTIAILVRFVLEQESGKGEHVWDSLAYDTQDNSSIMLGDYIKAEALFDYLESEDAEHLVAEYNRLMKQGIEYLRLMGPKYENAVKMGKQRVIAELAAEMSKSIHAASKSTIKSA